ncbi:MAG: DUF2089 domain-containing protein [candidate division WOR-3 bacterium]|nr:DUF2089 domain-containing protein [candidate division WOR-3 bacterium]
MIKKIKNCPMCGGEMVISELRCKECNLMIKKDFPMCEFCQLPEEDYEFLKIFLRSEGKITDIEKILGVSYPTIKSKIENLLRKLNLAPYKEPVDPIDGIAEGKLSVDEAIAILKSRKKGGTK